MKKNVIIIMIALFLIMSCSNENKTDQEKSVVTDNIICTLKRNYIKEEIAEQLKDLYKKKTGADEVYIMPEKSLKKGIVDENILTLVFPAMSEVYILELDNKQFKEIFPDTKSLKERKKIKLAVGSFYANQIIDIYKIEKSKIIKTGKKEKEILREWLLTQ